jgi:MFS family permease
MIVVAALGGMHWRGIWLIGAGVLGALIPVLIWMLRAERTPQSLATQESSTGMGGRHWRRSDMLRHPLFWMLLPYLMMPPCFGTAFYFQQVHMAEVRGWTHAEFVALVPLYTVTGLVAMMSYGWAIDRFGSLRLLPLFQLPFAAGFWVLSGVDSATGLAVVFVLFALMTGGAATVFGAFWAEFYGTGHLGAIKSLGSAVMVLGSAMGPGLSGALIDLGYDFPSQAPGIAVGILAASLLAGLGVWRAARSEAGRPFERPVP